MPMLNNSIRKRMSKDLDVWFNGLDLSQLLRIFYCPPEQDYNDFIDDCDEYWWNLSPEEKEKFYQEHYLDV